MDRRRMRCGLDGIQMWIGLCADAHAPGAAPRLSAHATGSRDAGPEAARGRSSPNPFAASRSRAGGWHANRRRSEWQRHAGVWSRRTREVDPEAAAACFRPFVRPASTRLRAGFDGLRARTSTGSVRRSGQRRFKETSPSPRPSPTGRGVLGREPFVGPPDPSTPLRAAEFRAARRGASCRAVCMRQLRPGGRPRGLRRA